jgi:hypothetical protein
MRSYAAVLEIPGQLRCADLVAMLKIEKCWRVQFCRSTINELSNLWSDGTDAACPLRYFNGRVRPIAESFTLFSHEGMRRIGAMLLVLVLSAALGQAGVLTSNDLQKLSEMNAVFNKLTDELGQAFKRPNISRAESDCIRNTWQELNQISEDLGSYGYLIDIAGGGGDSSEEDAMRGIIRFAVDRAIQVLGAARKRLSPIPDQCLRFPTSVAASEQTLQFIDAATVALESARPRF